MSNLPTIFLSYSWENKSEAEEIDKHFESIGLRFLRDVRDIEYKSPIKEFMHQVGKTEYVVMLISNEFLNSLNCMYEVLELMRDREFNQRLLQVILPNAEIFDSKYRINLVKSWLAKREELEAELKTVPLESLGPLTAELKHYRDICNNVSNFLQLLVDENSISYSDLKSNQFQQLIRFMGIDKDHLLSELYSLESNHDKKQAIRDVDRFTRQNPSYALGFFTLGFLQSDPLDQIYFYD